MSQQNKTDIVVYNPLLNFPSLTTKDIELSSLPEESKQVIMASQNFPTIRKNTDAVEVRNTLVDTIIITIWESGFGLKEQEQIALANYMIEEIKRDFAFLTLEEVKIAFKKGIRNHYGDVFGMNIRTMYGWLTSYVEETRQAIKQLDYIKVKEDNKPKEISEDEKKESHKKWLKLCIDAYEEYKENGSTNFLDIRNSFYDYIRNKMKLVDLTKEESSQIENQAIQERKKELSFANARNYYEVIDFKSAIDRMKDGDETEQEKIRRIARRIALIKLFGKIKDSKIDLKSKIEEYELNNNQ